YRPTARHWRSDTPARISSTSLAPFSDSPRLTPAPRIRSEQTRCSRNEGPGQRPSRPWPPDQAYLAEQRGGWKFSIEALLVRNRTLCQRHQEVKPNCSNFRKLHDNAKF